MQHQSDLRSVHAKTFPSYTWQRGCVTLRCCMGPSEAHRQAPHPAPPSSDRAVQDRHEHSFEAPQRPAVTSQAQPLHGALRAAGSEATLRGALGFHGALIQLKPATGLAAQLDLSTPALTMSVVHWPWQRWRWQVNRHPHVICRSALARDAACLDMTLGREQSTGA